MIKDKVSKKNCSLEIKRRRAGYVFVAPLIVGLVFFVAFPILQSLLFSFSKLNVMATGYSLEYKGLENFHYIFAIDPDYRMMVLSSIRDMLINVPIVILFSFFVASLLNQKFRGRSIVRTILFLPVIIASGVVENIDKGDQMSSSISSGIQITGSGGAGDQLSEKLLIFLQQLSISPNVTNFVIDTVSRVYDITIMSAVPIIIFLAGLQSVSPALFEASYIEGATKWEVFWKISFPMVSPLILVSVVYCIIDSFTNVSNTVINRIHTLAYDSLNFGVSAAMAWSYMLIILVILALIYKIIHRYVFYYD